MIQREPLLMTPADLKTVRDLFAKTKIATLKTADAFPDLYGASRKGGAVIADGTFYAKGDEETVRRIRGRERRFVGSRGFPEGIVCGFTDIEQKRTVDGSEWSHASRQDDISVTELEHVECIAHGRVFKTQAEILAHSEERERQRQAVAGQPIETEAQKIERMGAAIGAAMRQRAPEPVAK